MLYKSFGAILLVVGCGLIGFLADSREKQAERELQEIRNAIFRMKIEIEYQSLPLPYLIQKTAELTEGRIHQLLMYFAEAVESQCHPNLEACMASAIERVPDASKEAKQGLMILGKNIGNLDREDQQKALEQAEKLCRLKQEHIENAIRKHGRLYQTLGICAGTALAIILV